MSTSVGIVHRWEHLTRGELSEILPAAVVVVPLGAIEQHGPALVTGTDFMLSENAVDLATAWAAQETGQCYVVASFLRIGASDHHLPFGGTISLSPGTLIAVLVDAMRSMASGGGRKVILINGHGGNSASCHAAAAAVTAHSDLAVAVVDYWSEAPAPSGPFQVPGHAGQWETSLMLALRPDLARPCLERGAGKSTTLPGMGLYSSSVWATIDGYTDHPERASAEEGRSVWSALEKNLGRRLAELSKAMK